ncbi:MAG: paraquat-inducible protein A [Pseudomonadota bacterium]
MVEATVTARSRDLVGCKRCAKVSPIATRSCPRCGARLRSRRQKSMAQVWFWWLLGVVAYVPANVWPMLETRVLLTTSSDTIIAGAIKMIQYGSYGVAAVILIASVVIPLAKFAAIAFLALTVRKQDPTQAAKRHKLYHVVEFVGRWSMVDVFVVAILSSLVQFSYVATVKPGPAALAFALSVIFTMLSALSFDPRLIWDRQPDAPAPSSLQKYAGEREG